MKLSLFWGIIFLFISLLWIKDSENNRVEIIYQTEESAENVVSHLKLDSAETTVYTKKSSQSRDSYRKFININSANSKELMAIKGIGKVKAERIIAYRDKNGAFNSIDELIVIKGIGLKSIEKFKKQNVTVK